MTIEVDIRTSLPTDQAALETLYPAAFPDEDLLPLLRELLSEEDNVLSLVAVSDGTLVGHIAFTMCGIAGHSDKVGLLGPLAVGPRYQRQGIGGTLIRHGLNRLKNEGAIQVNVLGDPAYYGRFGFVPDNNVLPPYDMPKEWQTAWQSISLNGTTPELGGRLSVPKPWRQAALWAP